MRQLKNWIDGFVEGTEHLPSPSLFRKWAGIACIAGVLERKVWVKTMHSKLFPNMYTILVGPPGVGKSVVLRQTEALWRSIEGLHVAPKSVSKASLMDSLGEAKRNKSLVKGAGQSIFLNFNSLLVNAGELGVFIPQYDPEFMNSLTDVYDGDIYEERKRTKDLNLLIKEPCLNIIGGTTPSYLNQVLPEGAWDQGFLSRTFLIFCGTTNLVDLFSDDGEEMVEAPLFPKLRSDLRSIFDMIGAFSFAPEAQAAIRQWHMAGGPPRPDHPKLINYCTRRSAHLLKLSMIACASRSDDMIIALQDFQTALGWMLEAEAAMEEIFKALGAKGDGQTISEAIHFIYSYMKANDNQPMMEQRLVAFLTARVPAYNVIKLIELMEKSGQIVKQLRKDGSFGYLITPRAFDS